jgi:TATA-box binding protein (TBP) (component of TFIID and TFIIIB)
MRERKIMMGDDEDDGLASFLVQNIVASASLGHPLHLPGKENI